MNFWLNFYQHLPERINPMTFHVGSFRIGWYSLMYIAAFLTVYLLLLYRIKNKEFPKNLQPTTYNLQAVVEEFIFYSFLGVLIGGRLGYVLFYNFPYYWNDPMAIINPFDAAGKLIGIYGMSYHGGLIGVILATWYFVRKNKLNFWSWADFVVPAIPAGFFFGRIGNFLNGELYGRITAKPWGMYFWNADPRSLQLRHPSQLYEAVLEGLVLFIILWALRNKKQKKCHPELVEGSNSGKSRFLDFAKTSLGMTKEGGLLVFYIFLYGFFRIFVEFFREPDPQIGFILKYFTLGQIFSAGMVMAAIIMAIYQKSEKRYNT